MMSDEPMTSVPEAGTGMGTGVGAGASIPATMNSREGSAIAPAPAVVSVTRSPTLNERLLAAVAHLLLLCSVPGLLLTTAIWLTQRRRSVYVARQARQALFWQIFSNVVFILAVVALLAVALLSTGVAIGAQGTTGKIGFTGLFGSLLALYLVLIVGAIFFIGSSLIGALAALFGRHFRYPLIGRKRRKK